MKQLIIAISAVLLIISCKKETEKNFSAAGFWQGNIYIANAALLNRPNGTCRLYLNYSFDDTANGGYAEGTYEVVGSVYHGQFYEDTVVSIIMTSEETSENKMAGRCQIGQYNYEFELSKK